MAKPPTIAEIEAALAAEIAVILARDPAAIDRQASLPQQGLDSVAFVALLVFVEKQYGLKLINTTLGPESFRSVAALADAIHGLL